MMPPGSFSAAVRWIVWRTSSVVKLMQCKLFLKCRSEEHTSELQSRQYLVCRLLLEKKKGRDDTEYTGHRTLSWGVQELNRLRDLRCCNVSEDRIDAIGTKEAFFFFFFFHGAAHPHLLLPSPNPPFPK